MLCYNRKKGAKHISHGNLNNQHGFCLDFGFPCEIVSILHGLVWLLGPFQGQPVTTLAQTKVGVTTGEREPS